MKQYCYDLNNENQSNHCKNKVLWSHKLFWAVGEIIKEILYALSHEYM